MKNSDELQCTTKKQLGFLLHQKESLREQVNTEHHSKALSYGGCELFD